MKRLWVILFVILIFSCEDKKDTTPPEVTITSPTNGSKVNEVVTVSCMSTDNKEVSKVELWVDGQSTGLIDETEPYSFQWNTTTYSDGDHTLIVRGYDTSVGALLKNATVDYSEGIRWIEETTNVVLNGATIKERWHDEEQNIFYTLMEYGNIK